MNEDLHNLHSFERAPGAETVRQQLHAELRLPTEIMNAPEVQRALDIAAGVVAMVNRIHGNGEQIVRSEHTGNYASYHHGKHTREVAVGGPNYLGLSDNPDPEEVALSLLAGAYHDVIQGQKEPGMNEELSAQIAERELLELGYSEASARRVGNAVRGTRLIFADEVIRQVAYESDDPVVIATAIGDLGGIAQGTGPEHCLTLFAEFNPDILAGEQEALSQTDIMQAIDATPGASQRLATYLSGQVGFFKGVEYPAVTQGAVDGLYPLRLENAEYLDYLSGLVGNGTIGATQAFESTGRYAEEYEGLGL